MLSALSILLLCVVSRFHSQVQSRLERVGTGVLRFATGKKVIKDLPLMKQTTITLDEYTKWLSNHSSIIRELVNHQMTTYELDINHMHEFIHEGWLRTERELLRERGVWGPDRPSVLDKHMLDMTEGPLRMRIKMERNEDFYKHYPFRVKTDVCIMPIIQNLHSSIQSINVIYPWIPIPTIV